MDENFEEELSGLMRYRSEPAPPFTVGDVLAAARRRSRTRTLGVAGSALAVVAVGVGAVSLAGNGAHSANSGSSASGGKQVGAAAGSPPAAAGTTPAVVASSAPAQQAQSAPSSTTSSPTQALGVSPVKTVASGEKITVVDGYQIWVTSHEKCESESAAYMGAPESSGGNTVCKDVTGPNMAWDGTSADLGIQGSTTRGTTVLSGTYQGKTVPSLIEVEQDGKRYPATIVETPGMEQNHWVAYYVTFPASTNPVNSYALPYTVFAYDANGTALTQSPPAGPSVVSSSSAAGK